MMQSERELGHRWFEQVWNQGRREAIDEMMASDAVMHDGSIVSSGRTAFYSFFDRFAATFSEIHVVVEDTIVEGDKLCIRWSFTGKHTGSGLGIAPTGLTVHTTGISMVRVADHMFVEAWQNWDMLGLLEQIKGLDKSATYIAA